MKKKFLRIWMKYYVKNKLRNIKIWFLPLLTFISSCKSDFLLDIKTKGDRVLVIEGFINNLEPAYVRITWSNPDIITSTNQLTNESQEPEFVQNATVIIKDGNGKKIEFEKDYDKHSFDDKIDFRGYYIADNFIGESGQLYIMSVKVDGKEYTAEAKMPEVTNIDNVKLKFYKGLSGKNDGFIPVITFNDNPQIKNFYLTKFCQNNSYDWQKSYDLGINGQLFNVIWNFSIINDEFLKEYVSDLNLDIGASSSTYFKPILNKGKYQARLYNINEEAYNYYKILIESFKNDGGAYKPTPANAPTNIKGGALGFFNVSAVSVKQFEVLE